MPGLQGDGVVAALGSPIKKSRLSLKFFQKKEAKRALDFSEAQAEEQTSVEPEEAVSCDQVVPVPCPASPLSCERNESLVPFVGLNNLGNTCYLNSILQVLYYCPGFKDAIKKLHHLSKSRDQLKEEGAKSEEEEGAVEEPVPQQEEGAVEEPVPVHMELLGSFHSLIASVEQLQSSFLLHPDKYSDGELATPPRRLLNTLRQLNPMYEGYLQHDAQEVLQCILGYIQEACETIRGDREEPSEESAAPEVKEETAEQGKNASEEEEEDGQLSGKRKSDTEAGNAKKKPKSQAKKTADESQHFTRSKRKSSGDIATETGGGGEQKAEEAEKDGGSDVVEENENESAPKEPAKRKKRAKLSWLKPSGKQPSIFSKFRSMGRLSAHVGAKAEGKEEHGKASADSQGTRGEEKGASAPDQMAHGTSEGQKEEKNEEQVGFDVLKRLFQGQLVLRTRCLECECYTERREDFQDISVPVQEDESSDTDGSSEISPEPKPELKTLKWAISQFASVERIVGQDKYFCETCHHYTEAERSLLFDKTPEVVTIHLKCFSANGLEIDPYAGLSKVNTPLQTPLRLSLEEWSTRPAGAAQGLTYELFAVVMHSGVTISSGHYTTYIRMMDLHDVQVKPQSHAAEEEEEEPFRKEEVVQDYDDGEVSFSLSGKAAATPCGGNASGGKAGAKRPSEGVGLLGGQRSISSYELGGSKQANPDKAAASVPAPPRGPAVKKEREDGEGEGRAASVDLALQSLLDYEGKWMLFDDSEVRLFSEADFLSACSPETCSTSTPYLLFYKKDSPQRK